ncbi:MAG: acyltransferase [Sphingomonadales bacterium]|nr:MAG: acyltransferase [Sphingomonadales bacterium]
MGRLHTIDGMRGIAALFVMIGHISAFLMPFGLPRYWLAVDLFFLISGYVLGRVYEPRFREGMTAKAFMLARYIRLYPLYLVAILLAIFGEGITLLMGMGKFGAGDFTVTALTGAVMLPSPTWRTSDLLFPLNFPAWSLFFELVVNLVFVLAWRRLSAPILWAIVLACGIGVAVAMLSGEVNGGTAWSKFWWGFPRVGFSFFLGVLMQRWPRAPDTISAKAWIPLLALVAIFLVDPPHGLWFDALMVLVGFPLIVWFGAGIAPRTIIALAILGDISFGVYVLHVPILALFWKVILFRGLTPLSMTPWIGFVLALVVCAAAYALNRHYDIPARRWLGRSFVRPRKA